MDMKQLTTFVTLAKTLNYQKAAEQLQYAPSTLFKHIQLLEQELSAELFAKVGRQLTLTEKGEAFVGHAQSILDSYRAAIDSISQCDQEESSLTIGGCELNTANNLLGLFAQFSRAYPKARLSMMTSPNADVPRMVKNDLMDMGFFYSIDGKNRQGLETVRLYRQGAYLMAAKDHPLHKKTALCYEDLNGVPFVYPHDTCCLVTELMRQLERRGVRLGKTTYLGNVHLVVEHVYSEKAITLLPHCAVQHFREKHGIEVLDLGEPIVSAWNTIVYRNYETMRPLARALLQYSRDYAQRLLREDPALEGENGM